MRAHTLLVAIALLLAAPSLRAQKEANVWYFGRGAGIDFNGGIPRPLAGGAIDQKEGCASIADPVTGELLLYTDGVRVYNRDHRVMPNGAGLLGHNDATQSALIVPAPCSPHRFYIFTADASPLMDPPNVGIHYSVVDLTLDGGRGDVVTKNVQLYAPSTEKLTAVQHANGRDFWVVTHEWGSNLFRTYLVSPEGVSPTPSLSYIGSAHEGSAAFGIGYLKASPDGRRMISIVTTSFAELFDFDASRGLLSNPRRLSSHSKYGASFSPDGRLLYLVERRIGWGYDSLLQFDVTAGSEAAILASRTAVGGGDFWALQGAPDGRIYIANNSAYLPAHLGWLSTIDRPNERGAACGFDPRGFRLDVAGVVPVVTEGLPNLIESFASGLIRPCGPPEARIAFDDPICAGECVELRDSSTNRPTSWQWSFEGGRPSVSTEQNPPAVCFDSPGEYRVVLIATNNTGSDTVERTITVRGESGIVATAGEATVSPGDTATIPVALGAIDPGTRITEITVRLRYDPTMMRPTGLDLGDALLAGWSITFDADSATSTVIVRATAPPGAAITTDGRLLSVRFATWLQASSTASLPLSVEVPGGVCSTIPGRPGALALEICGLQQRLVELAPAALLIRQTRPNPVRDETRIAFVTPLDARVRLAVHDATGRESAVILDEMLPAGEHEVLWRASLPPGVYLCRLSAGGGSASRVMRIE